MITPVIMAGGTGSRLWPRIIPQTISEVMWVQLDASRDYCQTGGAFCK